MLRLYHLLLGIVLIPVGITTAVSYYSENQSSKENSLKTPVPITTKVTATSNQTNIWTNLLEDTPLPPGWTIKPCQDKDSLLCVSANGELLGTVEMGILPLETQLNFQKMLLNAGIPEKTNLNDRNSKYTSQVTTALNSWVKNHYGVLAKSRKYVYDNNLKTAKTADGILFAAYPPQKTPVGKLQGVSYGFAGLKQKGGVSEQHRGYVAFDGKALYLISTAFNPASSTVKFENLDDLSVFQPYLHTIVANLKLPN